MDRPIDRTKFVIPPAAERS
ncbi:unnamed protein product, partial [Rotaria magnacalcarata]